MTSKMEDEEKWYRQAYMGYELEQDEWREESRARVDEAIRKGSRFHGTMQTKANIEALEAAKKLCGPPTVCASCDD